MRGESLLRRARYAVKSLVKRKMLPEALVEDMVQEAACAGLLAMPAFDRCKSPSMGAYLWQRMYWGVQDALKREYRRIGMPKDGGRRSKFDVPNLTYFSRLEQLATDMGPGAMRSQDWPLLFPIKAQLCSGVPRRRGEND